MSSAALLLRLVLCLGVASASFLSAPAAPAPRTRARRAAAPICEETLPESAKEVIPPAKMAEAWRRDEKATELRDTLKGCSLYVTGIGARKNAVGRALARRLEYRYYDVPALMCTTYKTLSGGAESAVSLQTLLAAEPLADVQELSAAVMREVQALVKSVIVVWDGAVSSNDYMMMQQGIVACVESPEADAEVALPADGADDALAAWRAGHAQARRRHRRHRLRRATSLHRTPAHPHPHRRPHRRHHLLHHLLHHRQADVTIALEEGMLPDDAAALLIKDLLEHIAKNPAQSSGWKAEADKKLAEQDGSA